MDERTTVGAQGGGHRLAAVRLREDAHPGREIPQPGAPVVAARGEEGAARPEGDPPDGLVMGAGHAVGRHGAGDGIDDQGVATDGAHRDTRPVFIERDRDGALGWRDRADLGAIDGREGDAGRSQERQGRPVARHGGGGGVGAEDDPQ